jgi:hypothetical protein
VICTVFSHLKAAIVLIATIYEPKRQLKKAYEKSGDTLPFKMFGPFGSVWCKTALAEVGLSLP